MFNAVAVRRIQVDKEFSQQPFCASVPEWTRVFFGERRREHYRLSPIAGVWSSSHETRISKCGDCSGDSTLGIAGPLRDLGHRGEPAIHEIGENAWLGTDKIWRVLMHCKLTHLRESAAQVDQIVQLHLAMLGLI